MSGSETSLEELLSRVLGEVIKQGFVAKLADDLYIGGTTPRDLLSNWTTVLECLDRANLKLSSTKTVVGPNEVTILGWIWRHGEIHASPHKVAALSMCAKPVSIKNMRSFLGAYKMLARVIPGCSTFLHPLNRSTAGKSSQQRMV